MNKFRRVMFFSVAVGICVIGTVALFNTAYGDQTDDVTINTTGDFKDDPGGMGIYDRELMMKGEGGKSRSIPSPPRSYRVKSAAPRSMTRI